MAAVKWWARQRNATILLCVGVAVVAAAAFVIGWQLAQIPPAPIVIQLQAPK